MKSLISLTLITLFCFPGKAEAQMLNPRQVCRLPDIINESSGVEISSASILYTHNDSGDKAVIYTIDTLGNLLQTIKLLNVTATDFEDITRDAAGNMYVGDFGNNANNRKNLRIYKIPPPESLLSDSLEPELIQFSYPDQFQFPPDSSRMNFDCEAMFYFRDSLYLFSKNRGASTYCRMYRLPCEAGTYIAALVDSFDTHHWITSADINTDGTAMALLSESRIWLFQRFTGSKFFSGQTREIEMPSTQKEGIVFLNHHEVYLTDEREDLIHGFLYFLDLQDFMINPQPGAQSFSLKPNPTGDIVSLQAALAVETVVAMELFNMAGQKIKEENLEFLSGYTEKQISIKDLSAGIYFIHLVVSGSHDFNLKLIKK